MADCRRCKHYYITWDKNFPYGCRAMEFKSFEQPCLAVFNSSGTECLRFEPRKTSKNPQNKCSPGHKV